MIDIADAFFNSGDEVVAVLTTGATSTTLTALFSNEYEAAELYGVRFEAGKPVCWILESTAPAVVEGTSTAKINNLTYTIIEKQSQDGILALILAK